MLCVILLKNIIKNICISIIYDDNIASHNKVALFHAAM